MSGLGLASHQSMIDTEKDGDYEDKLSAADVLEKLELLCNVCKSVFVSLTLVDSQRPSQQYEKDEAGC